MSRAGAPLDVRLDPRYFEHPKTDRAWELAGAEAVCLHIAGLCYANTHLTNGFIPEGQITGLCARLTRTEDAIGALVQAGLWHTAPGGFTIHDFVEYQATREEVDQRRARWRKQKRQQRVRRGIRAESATEGSFRSLPREQSADQAVLPISHATGPEPLSWANVAARLDGADPMTPAVITRLGRDFAYAEGPLQNAWEALQERRARTDMKPLVSEVRYFVATLRELRNSGTYQQEQTA